MADSPGGPPRTLFALIDRGWYDVHDTVVAFLMMQRNANGVKPTPIVRSPRL